MKIYRNLFLMFAMCGSLLFIQCSDDDDNGNVIDPVDDTMDDMTDDDGTGGGLDFSGTFVQEDQMGRPGINTVFGTEGMKDSFNVTVPSEMQAAFQSDFQDKLLALNPGYTTNALGLDAATFTTVLSNDVLWVAQNGVTSYFNGTEVLTGRALSDDVIDISLLLIFGGPDGTDNDDDPTSELLLTRDGVPSNDVAFSTSFPYLAQPF
ncbi:DUF4331 family protein [Altibacter sp. HG106]|uniref:DUF4331 family protein n=1 Tax=Altibacter sp. HG106 TaxID=3023937 RepID=UPI0023506EF2|nr:DUF4331 family protein [Altibacter sp. HG106]MDC7993860.1 DUF4331 family protein [Altibacter sp. HG106]